MNFEKRKTVIFMIFFTPYWVSGTKGYSEIALFEAAKAPVIKSLALIVYFYANEGLPGMCAHIRDKVRSSRGLGEQGRICKFSHFS